MKMVTDSTFETEVVNSEVPVLVYFGATWCGPCRMLGPIMESIAETMKDKAKVLKIDVDDNPNTSSVFGITAVPTVIFFDKGEVVEKFSGVKQANVYTDILESMIGGSDED